MFTGDEIGVMYAVDAASATIIANGYGEACTVRPTSGDRPVTRSRYSRSASLYVSIQSRRLGRMRVAPPLRGDGAGSQRRATIMQATLSARIGRPKGVMLKNSKPSTP